MGLYQQQGLRGSPIWTAVVLSGLLAATVGPASAILMLPRITVSMANKLRASVCPTLIWYQPWPEFSTHFWLNGTTDDFWPGTLTKKNLIPNDRCIAGRPGGLCVSAGLPMLLNHYGYSKNENGGFVFITPEEEFPRHIEGAPRVSHVNVEAWTYAPHAPTSFLLTNM